MDSESSDNESIEDSHSSDSEYEDKKDIPKIKRKRSSSEVSDDDYCYLPHASESTEFGPSYEIGHLNKPIDIFSYFITDQMIDDIVSFTNREIQIKKARYKRDCNIVGETNAKEIKALIGMLVMTAVTRSNHLPIHFLFNAKFCGDIYKANMTVERCQFLLCSLQFSDKTRKQNIFSDLWKTFVRNIQRNFMPGNFVTVGEHMIPFRGKCPFKSFSSKQKCRYGIGMKMLIDVSSKYIINVSPVIISKATKKLNLNSLKALVESLNGYNKNLTIANSFVSIPLALHLLQEPYKFTVVGPIKSRVPNKTLELEDTKSQKSETSMFSLNKIMKMLSFKPKQNKRQFIVSTLHNQPYSKGNFEEMDLLQFYNRTKGVFDVFSKLHSKYTVKRRTDNWETYMFFFMIDLALINMYIIYEFNMKNKSEKCLMRRDFYTSLSEQLMESWLEERFANRHLSRVLRNTIGEILGRELPLPVVTPVPSTPGAKPIRRNCHFCPSKIHRRTAYCCQGCKKPICGEHNVPVCHPCAEPICNN